MWIVSREIRKKEKEKKKPLNQWKSSTGSEKKREVKFKTEEISNSEVSILK